MTTTEKTISMVSSLSEAEQLSVQKYIKKLLNSKKYELKPLTKKQILKKLDRSYKQAKKGETRTIEEVQLEMKKRYGF